MSHLGSDSTYNTNRSRWWRLCGLVSGVWSNRHRFACRQWLERWQTVFDLFLVFSPLHFAWNLYPSCSNLKICTPPYIAGFSLDVKAPNKYPAPLYLLIRSVRTLLSAGKPSINQSSSLYFPVGAQKQFLSMVPSITDYVGPTYSQHK